jgi:hypothetical protein
MHRIPTGQLPPSIELSKEVVVGDGTEGAIYTSCDNGGKRWVYPCERDSDRDPSQQKGHLSDPNTDTLACARLLPQSAVTRSLVCMIQKVLRTLLDRSCLGEPSRYWLQFARPSGTGIMPLAHST